MIRRLLTSSVPALLLLGLVPSTARAEVPGPGAVEDLRFSYSQSRATLTWDAAQVAEGGEPVVGYDVFLRRDGGSLETHRVAGRTFAFPLEAGRGVHGSVRAVTAHTAGSSQTGTWEGSGGVGLVVALDADHRAAYRLADQGIWHSLGDLTLVRGVAVGRDVTGTVLVVGADGFGHLWGRTLGSSWQRLGTVTCTQPAVGGSRAGAGFHVACLDGAGHLAWAPVDVKGGRPVLSGGLVRTAQKPQGRFGLVDDEAYFRTATSDAAGRNVASMLLSTGQARRLPLRCSGDVGAGHSRDLPAGSRGETWVACADGKRTVRYLQGFGQLTRAAHLQSPGAALAPVDVLGRPSVWQSGRTGLAQIGFVVGSGSVYEYDVDAGRWEVLDGPRALAGISAVPWVG